MRTRREYLRRPGPQPGRAAAARPRTSLPAQHRAQRAPAPAGTRGDSPPLRDRGISLLTMFTAAMLGIVALVCLVGGVDRWWILVPVMAVDLAVTGAVIAVMARLLDDDSGT